MHTSKLQKESKQIFWLSVNEYTIFEEAKLTEIHQIQCQGKSTGVI